MSQLVGNSVVTVVPTGSASISESRPQGFPCPSNQRTNGPVKAHLISGPRISTKYTKPGKNKVKK